MAERMSDLVGKTGENNLEKQSEHPEDSNFNPKRHRKKASRTRNAVVGGQPNDEERSGAEARALAIRHSHPYSDPWDSRHYQLVDSLKELEHRPARSASVFVRLIDKADSY
ncbi:hypothetical protein Adt_20976 [Abeliophyllum distichum]|uniref:Uncharacterized protein n=1 Tax=Abeliophyllum distichum TaxID=126358 RepID=A0ABD1SY55_9LAMI